MGVTEQIGYSPVTAKKFTLAFVLAKREILARYKGSVVGLGWALLNPLIMLSVYGFVFGVVVKGRWMTTGTTSDYVLILFCGLILMNFFLECLTRAPYLIIGNANYVKKIVFPVEILPIVTVFSALFQMAISFSMWVVFYIFLKGVFPVQIWMTPLLVLPLVMVGLGVIWGVSATTVYIRDLGQIVPMLATIFTFLTPIFYPATAIPERFRFIIVLNPVAVTVEHARAVLLFKQPFEIDTWIYSSFFGLVVMLLGLFWFLKLRKGFADVI